MIVIRSMQGPVPGFGRFLRSSPSYDEPVHETTGAPAPSKTSALNLSELVRKLRQRGIEVRHQAVIGDLEDRRLLVLIDSNNHLGVFHPGQMLNRSGNTDSDIEFRRHHLPGLTDLPVVRCITGIDSGTRGADCGTKLVSHRLDVLGEVLAALHCASAGDNDL